MADILDGAQARNFTITSFTDGNPPVGVNLTKLPWHFVHVNAPVHDWTITRAVGGMGYRLSVGAYPFVGVRDSKVIASMNPEDVKEWEIIRHEGQNAFTITLADDPHIGWTVEIGGEDGPMIVIAPIIATLSVPPQFLPKQLFLFKPAYND